MLPRRSAWLLPLLLGGFVFAVYIFTFPNDIQGNGDTWLRYEMTQSIMDHWTPYYSERGTPTWTDKRVVLGVSHKYVTIYDPGQIVAMAPGYEIGRFIAHHTTGDYVYTPRYTAFTVDDVFGALLAVLIFFLGLRLGYSRRASAILSLIFAFGTVAWPDAESYLEHTQVSFFLALSVLLSLTFVQGRMVHRRWLALAGLSVGCAFLTRYDTGILFPLIPMYVAAARVGAWADYRHASDESAPASGWRTAPRILMRALRQPRLVGAVLTDWIAYLTGVIPALLAAGLWNYARFGSFIKTGIPSTFGEPILQGFTGLTFSPGKGVIWYVPLLFALPFIFRSFYREHKLTTVFFASIVVFEFFLFSNVIYWHGDPAYGPRYIYPTIPYLILPLGTIVNRWRSINAWGRHLFVGLVALSVLIQFVGVVTPPYRFWYKQINAQLVSRQGFNWGMKDGHFWYFYYWNVPESPILVNFKNLYEITALRVFNQQQYALGVSPIPSYEHLNLSNPVHNYEINNYNLWWLSAVHPFLGTARDAILAFGWLILTIILGILLGREIRATGPPRRTSLAPQTLGPQTT